MTTPTNAFEVSTRFATIRHLLDKKITNSEHVIGTYVMTACTMMGEGFTDEQIVDDLAKHGIDKRPGWR